MFPEGRLLEWMMIGALALIVVGPKDLPVLMRKLGQFLAKMRALAAEFRASFDEMARQSELDELRREVEALRGQSPLAGANPLTSPAMTETMTDIHQSLDLGPATQISPAAAAEQAAHVEADPAAPAPESPPKRKSRAKPKTAEEGAKAPELSAPPPSPAKGEG
jgi:sec-independent protein translocase protein TatB